VPWSASGAGGWTPPPSPAAGLARNAVRAAQSAYRPSCHRRRLEADPFDWRGPLRPSTLDEHGPASLLAADRRDPARIAALRIDLAQWLDLLEPGRRRLALLLADGHRTVELAQALGLSKGQISQLRRELHRSWLSFHAGASRPGPVGIGPKGHRAGRPLRRLS
jgi:hypothetical protein